MHAVSKNSNIPYRDFLCCGTVGHEHNDNRWCQKGEQNAAIMFLSYFYLSFVERGLLQGHNDKCCSLVRLLCTHFCYFILLKHGEPVLNKICFSKIMCH